jgi:lipid-binding SYLF domain-containing protein
MFNAKRSVAALMLALVAVVWLPGSAARVTGKDNSPADEIKRVDDAVRVLQEMTGEADKSIPVKLLNESAGIAIIPNVIKAAYIIGGRHGNGVLLVRGKDGAWSNPAFISITGGSFGWQLGIQSADIILVFRTPRSIDNIKKGKFTLGADIGIAAGPLGRTAEASTDAEMKAEIYSYSRSRGLYAGLSVQGASLHVDAKADQNFYGIDKVSAQAIFEGRIGEVPEAAGRLRAALEKFSKSSN